MRFWDTSAFVPLLIEQQHSAAAERWASEDPQWVVWTLSGVEAASAIRRNVREHALSESDAHDAERLADQVLASAHVISNVERVKDIAGRLLRLHPLRAADALQLGAALAWANGSPKGLVFHTLDRHLGIAARREGFEVIGVEP